MQDTAKTNGKSSTEDSIDLSGQQDSKQEKHTMMDVLNPGHEILLPMTNANNNQLLVRTFLLILSSLVNSRACISFQLEFVSKSRVICNSHDIN